MRHCLRESPQPRREREPGFQKKTHLKGGGGDKMPVKAKKSKSSSAGRTLSRLLAKFFAGAAVFFCAFSAFFAIQAHACERGEAKVEIDHEGRYSSAARGKYVLLFCDGVFLTLQRAASWPLFLRAGKETRIFAGRPLRL